MKILKRLFNQCATDGCKKECVCRVSSVVGECGTISKLYIERKYCLKCGLKAFNMFAESMKIDFKIDEEFRKIIDEEF